MRTKGGFTLVELLVVIAVIGVLMALATAGYTRARNKAKLSRVSSELETLATAVSQYAQDNNYQYPADVGRGLPSGLEKYLAGGVWPASAWPHGVYDWDNWLNNNQQVYQISYRLCNLDDPESYCRDPQLFPNFTRNSSIFYCIQGPCVPHEDEVTAPGYCVNCLVKKVNY